MDFEKSDTEWSVPEDWLLAIRRLAVEIRNPEVPYLHDDWEGMAKAAIAAMIKRAEYIEAIVDFAMIGDTTVPLPEKLAKVIYGQD